MTKHHTKFQEGEGGNSRVPLNVCATWGGGGGGGGSGDMPPRKILIFRLLILDKVLF